MHATFIHLPEKKVVGLGTKFISAMAPDQSVANPIPALWGRFMGLMHHIPHRMGDACYGLTEPLPGNQKTQHYEMFYIAGVEVAEIDSIPTEMISRILPAGQYAAFTHKGKLDGVRQTMAYIYGSWLPTADVKLRAAPHVEVYDDRFIPGDDRSEFDILLPVA